LRPAAGRQAVSVGPGRRCPAAPLALLAILVFGCCRPPAPPTPEDVALQLFELARQEEPDPRLLDACFGPLPDESARAALLDALEPLAAASAPRVVARETLPDAGVVVVDVVAGLRGRGSADYSMHLEGSDEEGWKVRWFRGPGVEWPRPGRPAGQGLTSSRPPD